MIGVEKPRPGVSADHLRFCESPQAVGAAHSATPVPCGPRHDSHCASADAGNHALHANEIEASAVLRFICFSQGRSGQLVYRGRGREAFQPDILPQWRNSAGNPITLAMAQVLILGGGMVGSTMALDLASDPAIDVAVADRSDSSLSSTRERVCRMTGRDIRTIKADLSEPAEVGRLAAEADLVLGALSSKIGFKTLRAVIEAGVNYCDISFMPENFLDLDELARGRGVTAVCDCGVAPGLSNMLAGCGAAGLDRCENIEIYVGGIPKHPRWPFDYKAAFSPYDVIEEYTRPARLVEGGRIVTREALSEPEIMPFDRIGDLEAFNTDGLRSLIFTIDCPQMKEKTLRYPGHIHLMRVFRETGLFSHEPVKVQGQWVRPIDVTSSLLFPKWTYEPGEPDLTIMRVIVEGRRAGAWQRFEWALFDEYDRSSDCTSMSRTTAFPATMVARLLLEGAIEERGVLAPEHLARIDGLVPQVIDGLIGRGIVIRATREPD